MIRFLLSISVVLGASGSAHAHAGHLGELAGHAHWLGLGAVVAAGAIVAVLGKKKITDSDQELDSPASEPEEAEAA